MSKVPFAKVALTYQAQIQLLKERGLVIGDEAKALFLLENISYYRLSGYWFPLLADKIEHQFKNGASFENAFRLYCFDKELRKLFLSELEKIEVAIRAKMIYILSHAHGPFWFQNPELFRNQFAHTNSINKIGEEFDRSDEEFIAAFKKKYNNSLPPSWMILEITSFGSLSKLYSFLNPGRNKREIANHFGLSDSVFSSWLHSIVYLRNVCAHHSRLWNRVMSISPQFPQKAHKPWLITGAITNNRSYFMLCMVKYLLHTVNPRNSLKSKIDNLLAKYPNVDIGAMGFPPDWKNEPLWQK
jgi:abortive infection bacteriophage resistance protein